MLGHTASSPPNSAPAVGKPRVEQQVCVECERKLATPEGPGYPGMNREATLAAVAASVVVAAQ